MKKQFQQAIVGVAGLWLLAVVACLGVFVYHATTGFLAWRSSPEEVRADGETVVAAVEQYKSLHGHYPENLQDVGIQPDGWSYSRVRDSLVSYRRYKIGDRETYGVTAYGNVYGWTYDHETQTWDREEPATGGGG